MERKAALDRGFELDVTEYGRRRASGCFYNLRVCDTADRWSIWTRAIAEAELLALLARYHRSTDLPPRTFAALDITPNVKGGGFTRTIRTISERDWDRLREDEYWGKPYPTAYGRGEVRFGIDRFSEAKAVASAEAA
jgi:hypothetical protein